MAAIPVILQFVIAFFGAYFVALWFSMIISLPPRWWWYSTSSAWCST